MKEEYDEDKDENDIPMPVIRKFSLDDTTNSKGCHMKNENEEDENFLLQFPIIQIFIFSTVSI